MEFHLYFFCAGLRDTMARLELEQSMLSVCLASIYRHPPPSLY